MSNLHSAKHREVDYPTSCRYQMGDNNLWGVLMMSAMTEARRYKDTQNQGRVKPILGILRFTQSLNQEASVIMTYYEHLFEVLFNELNGVKGVSVLIQTNDMYMARALSFSYKKMRKNLQHLEEFARIVANNELVVKIAFVGRTQNLNYSDLVWYRHNQGLIDGFIPDRTIKLM